MTIGHENQLSTIVLSLKFPASNLRPMLRWLYLGNSPTRVGKSEGPEWQSRQRTGSRWKTSSKSTGNENMKVINFLWWTSLP